jgi:hypothetical protein
MDFVTCQSYCTPSPPEQSGMFDEMRVMREIFRRHNSPKTRIWIAEWSYFDHLNLERPEFGSSQWIHSSVSRDMLSAYVVREALTCVAAGAVKTMPNAIFQVSRQPLHFNYGHTMTGCSSHRYDNTPLPLYFGWSVLARNIEGKTCKGMIDCGPGVYCVRFDAAGDLYKQLGSTPSVLAVWAGHGSRPLALNVGRESVAVQDFVGNITPIRTVNGVVVMSATERPQYILLDGPPKSVKAVPPVITPEEPQYDVTYGEDDAATVSFRVTNPSEELPFTAVIVFDGPNWCQVERPEIKVEVAPGESEVATFPITVPKENQDRVHYEFDDVASRALQYVRVRLLNDAGEQIGASSVPLIVHEPIEVLLRPQLIAAADQEKPKLLVTVRNNTKKAKKGTVQMRTKTKLRINPAAKPFTVQPEDEATLAFDVAGMTPKIGEYSRDNGYLVTFGIGEGYVVETIVSCDDGTENRQTRGFAFFPSTRAKAAPNVDGKDEDWADATWFDVTSEGRTNGVPFFADVHSAKKEDASQYFSGDADLSARWATKWDNANLYLFFRVKDNKFHQPNTGDMIWNGDSVVFAFDPSPDTTDAGVQPVARDPASFVTFEVGLTPKGPQLYRRYAACGLPAGLLDKAKVNITRTADGLAYEIAIPWAELGAAAPKPGGWAQMSIAFHDSDGHGRKTWIAWFGGLGNIAREPRLMGDVNFTE